MIRRRLVLALVLAAIGACTRSVLLTPPPDAGSDGGLISNDGWGGGHDGGADGGIPPDASLSD